MTIELELTVIAVHGEGDRDTVNALQAGRNGADAAYYLRNGHPVPPELANPPDEPSDVVVVLRDDAGTRLEKIVADWDEVEQWKTLAGYDADKRHWQNGAKVKVQIG